MLLAPPVPLGGPPMLGIAPPPLGPRNVNPRVVKAVSDAIRMLLDVLDLEPDPGLHDHIDKLVAPLIDQAIEVSRNLSKPIRPPREVAEDAGEGPPDQPPTGDVNGTPLAAALPRLLGLARG